MRKFLILLAAGIAGLLLLLSDKWIFKLILGTFYVFLAALLRYSSREGLLPERAAATATRDMLLLLLLAGYCFITGVRALP